MIYEARAPTRIDLAGGTLDIWPLYVLEESGLTVNAAIDLYTKAKLTERDDKKVSILSRDLKTKAYAENIDGLATGELELYCRIARYFEPDFGFDVELSSSVPAGSGLGASSSLAIAFATLLNKLTGKNLEAESLIQLVGNLEAKAIMINTGKQDYYAALYGGVNSIWFGADGDRLERHNLSDRFMKKLSGQAVLCFTGESHFSATNNWNMLKKYIDNVSTTRLAMKNINKTAHNVYGALKGEDMDGLVSAINEEWENRKKLADGVTTGKIELLISAAKEEGALAAKICGAGGGGCLFLLCDEGSAADVKHALEKNGAGVLGFNFDYIGARLDTKRFP